MAKMRMCLSTLATKTPGSAELVQNLRSVRVQVRPRTISCQPVSAFIVIKRAVEARAAEVEGLDVPIVACHDH